MIEKVEIGDCILYHADCAEILPIISADALVTDPPYGIKEAAGKNKSRENDRLDHKMQATEGSGSLNPTWVEWLMGYPTGWTDLKDSETQSCLK